MDKARYYPSIEALAKGMGEGYCHGWNAQAKCVEAFHVEVYFSAAAAALAPLPAQAHFVARVQAVLAWPAPGSTLKAVVRAYDRPAALEVLSAMMGGARPAPDYSDRKTYRDAIKQALQQALPPGL